MNAERQRILEMVAAGQITASDAEDLLQAVRKPRPSPGKWLFQPLELLETRTALVLGGGAALAGLLLAWFGIRFDGALDVHGAQAPVAWGVALLDLVLAWPLTALIFLGFARLLARQGRFVDFLAAVGVARVPLVLVGVVLAFAGSTFDEAAAGNVSPAALMLGILLLPPLAWCIALLVTGLRTASGLRGGRLALAAVLAIVGAEIVTKLLLLAV